MLYQKLSKKQQEISGIIVTGIVGIKTYLTTLKFIKSNR